MSDNVKLSKLQKLQKSLEVQITKRKAIDNNIKVLQNEIAVEETRELKNFLTENNLSLPELKERLQASGNIYGINSQNAAEGGINDENN